MQLQMRAGRPPLPREHGGWAMLITPPVIAVVAAGPHLLGLMAALGWFVAYCLRGPIEALMGKAPTGKAGLAHAAPETARFWLALFGLVVIGLFGPVLYLQPAAILPLLVAMVMLGVVHLLQHLGATRSIAAGLLAIVGLMAGGPLYYIAFQGAVPVKGWALALVCGTFFAGSVFRVKTLARERRSGSFRFLSVGVHLLAVAVAIWAVWSWQLSPVIVAALIPALGWAVFGAVRAGAPISLAAIGHGEEWVTIAFGLLLMFGLRL